MEDKQIADYFVVAGLTDKSMPLEDFSFDGNQLKSTYDQAPITDITVIIPSLGEGIPPGYSCIEYTPTGNNYNSKYELIPIVTQLIDFLKGLTADLTKPRSFFVLSKG